MKRERSVRTIRLAGGGVMCANIFAAALSVGTWMAADAQQGAAAASGPAKRGGEAMVLMLSDIHFDPFRDPGKVMRLAESPVESWDSILHEPASADATAKYTAMQTECKARGLDSDSTLLDVSLQGAREKSEGVRFVTVTGDLLVHKFGCRYKAAVASRPSLNTAQGYESFAAKTANYVMKMVEAAFPKAAVYVALGNNDSGCGDYQMDENDRFLTDTATGVARGWRGAGSDELARAIAQYRQGGYYSLALGGRAAGGLRRGRLVVLNDIYMSHEYATCATEAPQDGAAKELEWLDGELSAAGRKGEQVWVIGHIPPGIDAYATLRDGRDVCNGGKKPETFTNSDALEQMLEKHADVVKLAVFGHSHTDEVRLVGTVPLKVVPSISPINGNVAGFTVAEADSGTARLEDYTVYVLEGSETVPEWKKEYRFSELYGKTGVTTANLQELIASFQADGEAAKPQSQAYVANYAAGMKVPLLALVWPKYTCTMANATAAAYKNCICTKH